MPSSDLVNDSKEWKKFGVVSKLVKGDPVYFLPLNLALIEQQNKKPNTKQTVGLVCLYQATSVR